MYFLLVFFGIFTYTITSPITYEDVRGTPYKVGYDHRAFTINGVRTMLISCHASKKKCKSVVVNK